MKCKLVLILLVIPAAVFAQNDFDQRAAQSEKLAEQKAHQLDLKRAEQRNIDYFKKLSKVEKVTGTARDLICYSYANTNVGIQKKAYSTRFCYGGRCVKIYSEAGEGAGVFPIFGNPLNSRATEEEAKTIFNCTFKTNRNLDCALYEMDQLYGTSCYDAKNTEYEVRDGRLRLSSTVKPSGTPRPAPVIEYCKRYPTAPSCDWDGSYCRMNPTQAACQDSSYCETHPFDEACRP